MLIRICFRLAHNTEDIFIVFEEDPRSTPKAPCYRIEIGCKEGVLPFGPDLPNPPLLTTSDKCRRWLLSKRMLSLSLSPLASPHCTTLQRDAHFTFPPLRIFSRQQRACGVLRARFSHEVPQHTEGSAAGHHRRVSPCRTEEEPLTGTENWVQHPQR